MSSHPYLRAALDHPTPDDGRRPLMPRTMAFLLRRTTVFGPKVGRTTDLPLSDAAVIDSMAPPHPLADRGPASDPSGAPEVDDELDGSYSGVHDVLKSVDRWFDIEVSQIEKVADGYAFSWSQENLPTLTDDTQHVLPPESVLAKLSGELWQRWPERIKVKMQDAVDAGAAELRGCVSSARAAIAETKLARAQLREAEGRIEQIRGEMSRTRAPVRYTRFMSVPVVVLLSTLLIAVEFIANQPVFRLIWPMQAELAAQLNESASRVAAIGGLMAGMRIALLEALGFFEASVLAFAVVVLLFVLAKSLGTALRPIVALRARDYPFAARSVSSLQRQKLVVGAICVVGSAAVLFFLFQARGGASSLVQGRLNVAQTQLQRLQARSDSLQRVGETTPTPLVFEISGALVEVERLTHDRDFAETVKAENGSILVLNVSLVCFAVVIGFLGAHGDISDTLGEHPDLPRLKEKCSRLSEQVLRHAVMAREQVTRGEMVAGRVHSLLRSRPLATLDAKRDRLGSIVPRWRAANAQQRGIQPESIAAFRRSAVIELPSIPTDISLATPEGFDDARAALGHISETLYGVERDSDASAPLPA